MGFYSFINDINYYIQLKLFFIEEIVVIFMFYNFIKLLIFNSIVELLWPTQIFNRKHSSYQHFLRFRTFTETVSKLRLTNYFYISFNKNLIKHILIKNVFKPFKPLKKLKKKKK